MNVADLTAHVRAHAIAAEVLVLADSAHSVAAAARAAGVAPERIVKSVLFLAAGAPVLVIANGPARLDFKRLAGHLGLNRKRLSLADADTVLAVTGYAVGAVPPFGHPAPLRTLVDPGVLDQPEVLAGAGALDALLRITPAELLRVTQAELASVRAAAPADAEAARYD